MAQRVLKKSNNRMHSILIISGSNRVNRSGNRKRLADHEYVLSFVDRYR